MYQLTYQPGAVIIKQGEEGRNFYIVVHGNPRVTATGPKGEIEATKERGG